MATGQQIAFDYAGDINLFYDTSASATHLTSALLVDGQVNASGGIVAATATVNGAATFNGGLQVNGSVSSSGGFTGTNLALTGSLLAYGTGQFNGMLTASGGMTVGGAYLALPSYTVATLPTAPNGALAYASNGRKPGEAAGAGTGVLVWVSTYRWLSVLSGTQVLA